MLTQGGHFLQTYGYATGARERTNVKTCGNLQDKDRILAGDGGSEQERILPIIYVWSACYNRERKDLCEQSTRKSGCGRRRME